MAAPGVLDNDGDPEGDALIAMLDTDPAHGAVTVRVDGGFDYTPESSFSGEDSFTYLAHDGELSSEPIRVRLVVCASGGAMQSSGTANAQGDCGCSSATPVGGAVWLLGLISIGLRRRRHGVA